MSVVIGHQRNGMERIRFNKGTGENLAQIVVSPLTRGLVEVHLQRRIKQKRLTINLVNIMLQFIDVV